MLSSELHLEPPDDVLFLIRVPDMNSYQLQIYSLDGQIVQVLDRSKALPISFDPSEPEPPQEGRSGPTPNRRGIPYGATRPGVVRDVSWHSREPVMMSVGWGPGSYESGGGSVARHEWKGLGKNGMQLEDVVERDDLEEEERSFKTTTIPGGYPWQARDD